MTNESIQLIETAESIHEIVGEHYAAAAVRAAHGDASCSDTETISAEPSSSE